MKEALLTRFESGRITPPPLSDTVREKVKRDALTACLTVGTASLAWMLTGPIPRSVRQVRRFFVLLIAPGNGLSPPPPWDSLFPGFFIIPCISAMNCRGFFCGATLGKNRGVFDPNGRLSRRLPTSDDASVGCFNRPGRPPCVLVTLPPTLIHLGCQRQAACRHPDREICGWIQLLVGRAFRRPHSQQPDQFPASSIDNPRNGVYCRPRAALMASSGFTTWLFGSSEIESCTPLTSPLKALPTGP